MKYISGLLCGASLSYLFRVTLSGGQVILLGLFGLAIAVRALQRQQA